VHELRRDLEQYADDPVVRRTVFRLRISAIAVVLGVVLCITLAGLVATLSFRDGIAGGTSAGAGVPAAEGAVRAAEGAQARRAAALKRAPRGSAARTRAVAGVATAASRMKAAREDLQQARLIERASMSQAPERPGNLVFGLLVGGFLAVGFSMFLVVRTPYASAREHALELVHAWRTQQDGTLEAFAALNATVEAKDRYTAGHGLRVTLISLLIGQELGLPEPELDILRHAATFHDIGKIAVPDSVLQKEGRLTDTEWEQMKVHPVESARICSKLAALRPTVPAVRNHHERMDGAGYPDGLVGRDIPIGGRIIAVADSWDAITSDRPYRRGQPAAVALDEIRRCSGPQFDPVVVTAFIEVLAKDPWMFGLTPADVHAGSAADGRRPERPSRAVEELTQQIRSLTEGPVDEQPEIDWSEGFDAEDLAA